MTWIAGGSFAMGSEDFYPEERPIREVAVEGFWIDTAPVTVAQFRRFVRATGWITVAERDLDPAPGSLVFHPTPGPVPLDDFRRWWSYVDGACWHRPEGPGSDTYTRGRHPVVHVTPEDAEAYAAWVGAELPTEAEWEYAASAGTYERVNRWYGDFPWRGYRGTSPVGTFPPNDRGLIDMIGNVWEWTADWFTPTHDSDPPAPCCPPPPELRGEPIPRRVIKGGSHLCAPTYCFRYRPSARQSETVDTSTSHIGFRCVVRAH